ncbi:ribonuclease H-like domain-containing protein, partial [Tanacetum coccineum]
MLENQKYNKSKSDKGYHAVPPPYIRNFIPFKPDLMFIDEIVESENMDVITVVTSSNDKKVGSNHKSTDIKKGDAVEPKIVKKNNVRSPIIEDWNSDDDSKVEFIPIVKTVRPSTEKIKFVKSARETVEKGIKREFSVARTLQQNGVAERRNRTLIEASRTMLIESMLPTTFWAKVVNTACYVLNRVLVIKPHTKTTYELIYGRTPLIDFMKPFGCPVTILNTRDHLGKFDRKDDEGFFVGYSVTSKTIKVFNKRTRIVEETLNIRFLENAPNVKRNGPDWLFDIDSISMNYVPVAAGNQTNDIAGTKDNIVACQGEKKKAPEQEYIIIPLCTTDPLISQDPKDDAGMKPTKVNEGGAFDNHEKDGQDARSESERTIQ